MTRTAQVLFALLVCATLGAFVVVQRLKSSPRVVQTLTFRNAFSPNADGSVDVARFQIRLKRSDDVSIFIINRDEDTVRHLVDNVHMPAHRRLRFAWNGRDDAGQIAPDGNYRVRVVLRHQGRSVILLHNMRLDTTPPRPLVFTVGRPPAILPGPHGRPVRFRFTGPDHRAPRLIYRIWPRPQIRIKYIPPPAHDNRTFSWDGRYRGRPAPPGIYVGVVRVHDAVANGARSPVGAPARPGHPRGRPGVTVRYLAALPPLQPVRAGTRATFLVDARGRGYRWQLRHLGHGRVLAHGHAHRALLRVPIKHSAGGMYLLWIESGRRTIHVPLAVVSRRHHRILLVLSALNWQGANPVDDDGDGLPDTLGRGVPVSLVRPFAGTGLPHEFAAREAPLLGFLDRSGLSYDVTTDLALARGTGPHLAPHKGVVLAGDERWLPASAAGRLRRWVSSGGRLWSLGTQSLRRDVTLAGDALVHPARHAARTDAFGSRIAPLVAESVELLAFPGDSFGVFAGTGGSFPGFTRYETTRAPGPPGRQVAGAGPKVGQPVIVALRLGKGLVIRTGLPEWQAHLRDDLEAQAFTRREWALLSQ